MKDLPNPFDSDEQMFLSPDEAAAPDRSHAPCAAAEIISDREISLSELVDRGFDVNVFMTDIEPPPLFLQKDRVSH